MATVSTVHDPFIKDEVGGDKGQALNNVDTFASKEVVSIAKSFPLLSEGLDLPDDGFFARPVVIQTLSWQAGSTLSVINPWALWMNDPMIAARLKGRTMIRGTLVIRADLASNPYQYGLFRIFMLFGPNHSGITNNVTTYEGSQALGIDIDASVPGAHELRIPWVFPYDYFVITNANDSDFNPGSAGGVATHWDDAEVFGRLYMGPIVALARADNASAGSALIVVRAWVEDFEAKGPTRCTYVSQSSHGAISSVTSAFGRAAGELTSVPIIGGVASAVSKGLGVVTDIARFFGFSRPNVTQNMSVHERPNNTASTDSTVVLHSTCLSEKKEVSVNFKHLGLDGLDDMAVSKIASRPSIVKLITWATTSARGIVLMDMPVHPLMLENSTNPYHFTSLAAVALPFNFWRGSLIYTIRIVASKFHTGVLRVVYDPGFMRGTASAPTEDTTWPLGALENCLISVTPGVTKEIQICFCRPERWCPMQNTVVTTNSPSGVDYFNSIGKLSFVVENALQAPLSTASVQIVVYVRGGPDFQVFAPRTTIPKFGAQTPASATDPDPFGAIAPPGEDNKDIDLNGFKRQSSIASEGIDSTMCVFGGGVKNADNLKDNIFGESVLSLRALLKRFSVYGFTACLTDTAATKYSSKEITFLMPCVPPDFSILLDSNWGFTLFTTQTLFRHFRSGFVGWRGGTRYRINDCDPHQDNNVAGAVNSCQPARFVFGPIIYAGAANLTAGSGSTAIVGSLPYAGAGGSAVSSEYKNEYADFETPNYSSGSFRYAGWIGSKWTSTLPMDSVRVTVRKEVVDMTKVQFTVAMAAADDFSFVYWQGLPQQYDI